MRVVSVVGMPQSGSTMFFNIVKVIIEDVIKKKALTTLYATADPTSGTGAGSGGFSKAMNSMGVMTAFEIEHHAKKMSMEDSKLYERCINFEDHKDSVFLVKEHHFDKILFENSDIIFVSKRDIRDCILSRLRRGKKLNSKGQIKSGVYWPDDKEEMFDMYCEYLTNDCYSKWFSSKTTVLDYDDFCKNHKEVILSVGNALGVSLTDDQVTHVVNEISTFHDYDAYKTGFSPSKLTDKNLEITFTERELDVIKKKYNIFTASNKKKNPIVPKYITTKYKSHIIDTKTQDDQLGTLASQLIPGLGGIQLVWAGTYKKDSHQLESITIYELEIATVEPVEWTQEKAQAVVDGLMDIFQFISNDQSTVLQRYTDENGNQPPFSICRAYTASSEIENLNYYKLA